MQGNVEAITIYLKSQIYVCKTAFSENKHNFHEEQLLVAEVRSS